MIDYTGVVEASVISPTLIVGVVAGTLGIKEMTFSDLPMLSSIPMIPFAIAALLGVLEMEVSVISLGVGYIFMFVFLGWISKVIERERKKSQQPIAV
jgi:hypothetical protein